jgi:peptidoglycan/LPS O-acetylase OafA/YrhL
VVVALQGLAGAVFAVTLAVTGLAGHQHGGNVFGEAGYFAVLSAGVLTVGIGLVRGRRWARSPAVVVQLLLLGVAWYVFGPSARPLVGALLGVLCLAVLALLLAGKSQAWVTGAGEQETKSGPAA